MEGGEAQDLFSIPHKATAIRSLGRGRFLVTAVWEQPFDNPEEADYRVFEQLPFMANGQGFVGQRRTGLGIFETEGGVFRRITADRLDVTRCTLSDDGTRALVVGCDYTDVEPQTNGIYELDTTTGEMRLLTDGLTMNFVHAGWRNGRIVVTAADLARRGVHTNPTFYSLNDGVLTALAPDLDSSLHNCVGCDCRYGLADQTGAFFDDGQGLIYAATEGYRSYLFRLNDDGTSERLTNLSTVDAFDVHGDRIAMVGLKGQRLQELYTHEQGTDRVLSHFNDEALAGLDVSSPEHFTVDNGQGWELDGWVIKPIGFEPGRKYPTILTMHGGPKAVFGDVFFHEMQCMASLGWVVIYTNPRGSDGRGNEFDDIRGFYGVKDYHDFMVFSDWCVRNLPYVDENRMGVTGGSYGGFMTNWIVTHTHRFKAAASQRPISNWVSKFGSCDIGYYYVEDQHLGKPWETSTQPWDDSPLKYAPFAQTPLLIIQSSEDFRCEASQSFQMFTAMKTLGVECRLVYFNGENHELSRSGKPRNRLARLHELCSWFEGHL